MLLRRGSVGTQTILRTHRGDCVELRDYLRMVRRGWLTILVITLLGVAAAFLYLAVTPKTYGASTTLFVATAAPDSINDLQQGANFAGTAVVTYAQIIDSGTVLTPVAAELRPQRSVDELVGRVTATVREQQLSSTSKPPQTIPVARQ